MIDGRGGPGSRRRDGRAGFTLVEIVVVLMIMTIIAGVTVPALLNGGRPPDDDLTAATRRLETLFRIARDSAVRGGAPVTVIVDSATALVWLVPERALGAAPVEAPTGGGGGTAIGLGARMGEVQATPDLFGDLEFSAEPGEGTPLDLPGSVELEARRARARFTFLPTGAAIADSLIVRHLGTEILITIDPWTSDVVAR